MERKRPNLGSSHGPPGPGSSLYNECDAQQAYYIGNDSNSYDNVTLSDVETDTDTTDSHGPDVALKLVTKKFFVDAVNDNTEKPDSLIRETLSQVLLWGHFLCPSAVTHLEEQLKGMKSPGFLDKKLEKKKSFDRLLVGKPYLPIVQMTNVVETHEVFAMELELMSSTDLNDHVKTMPGQPNRKMSEQQVKQVMVQLVEAVKLCNRLGIAHRDIKPANIIFPTNEWMEKWADPKDDWMYVKLADYGMAGFVDSERMLRGRCGTRGYIAPDIFNNTITDKNAPYPLNVDMFSIGTTAYTLLCGYDPFYVIPTGDNLVDFPAQIAANHACKFEFHPHAWGDISEDAKDFISRCLNSDANNRLTPLQAQNDHRWLKKEVKRYES